MRYVKKKKFNESISSTYLEPTEREIPGMALFKAVKKPESA